MKLLRCDFCHSFFERPPHFRAPSGACTRCYLWIRAELISRELDFTPANLKRITYRPDDSTAKQ